MASGKVTKGIVHNTDMVGSSYVLHAYVTIVLFIRYCSLNNQQQWRQDNGSLIFSRQRQRLRRACRYCTFRIETSNVPVYSTW